MIALELYFRDVLATSVERMPALVGIFAQHGFAPASLGSDRSLPEMVKRLAKARLRGAEPVVLRFERTQAPAMSVELAVRPEPMAASGVGTILRGALAPSSGIKELVIALGSWGDPLYGIAHDREQYTHVDAARQLRPTRPFELLDIYSLNMLGKAMVDALGRKHVLTMAATKIIQLPGGGVVIDAGRDPEFHAAALNYLRPELPARTRKPPAPLARTWDPDVAPLFDRIVAAERAPDRNARITALNAVETAVTELRAPPLPATTEAALRFRSAADDLVAILRDKVTGLAANPAILPELDLHFYTHDYPGTFGRAKADKLVEPLGAWLGQLLVTELGGRWVTSRDEHQVVIGATAYLPFLRARRYLATKAAVLACSLTKYFAHARRAA